MKNTIGKGFNLVPKVIALGMAVFLLCFIAIQSMHWHPSSNKNSVESTQTSISSSDLCSLCDYFNHHSNDDYLLPLTTITTAPLERAMQDLVREYSNLYQVTLKGYTNKGPPLDLKATITAS
ncbi:MAG: hypothetical protein EOO90_13275 [Pedobacter sp.]|nr:MAG: hypothetical protein EOO90_13275 [Pedobacter sp.]